MLINNNHRLNNKPGIVSIIQLLSMIFLGINNHYQGWSGGAMVLGILPVPGRPTILITVGQGLIALAVGAGGVVWTFLL